MVATFLAEDYGVVPNARGRSLIILVEDSPADVYLICTLLERHGIDAQLFIARDGEEAMLLLDRLDQNAIACPSLIILDVNLPKRSGFEVLQRIRFSTYCSQAVVVILSSSDTTAEREIARGLGVAIYLKKPAELGEFMEIGEQLKTVLLS